LDGWAVYAARAFKADELVELTPFFVPLESYQTQHSVLDSFVFGFQRSQNENDGIDNNTNTDNDNNTNTNTNTNTDNRIYNVVLMGNGAFYNHHSNPNLRYVQVIERAGDDVPQLVGFRATRNIAAGEQLYVSYGDDALNMLEWSENRGLKLETTTEEFIQPNTLPFFHVQVLFKGIRRSRSTNLEGQNLADLDEHPLQRCRRGNHPRTLVVDRLDQISTLRCRIE